MTLRNSLLVATGWILMSAGASSLLAFVAQVLPA